MTAFHETLNSGRRAMARSPTRREPRVPAWFPRACCRGRMKGGYLMPCTPLAGEHSPEEIRNIAATLN